MDSNRAAESGEHHRRLRTTPLTRLPVVPPAVATAAGLTIRAVIVDDEALARDRLREMLIKERGKPRVEILRECATGTEAVQTIQELSPDLLFLDVQLPDLDGFAVLHAVGVDRVPAVVLVTAYGCHAIQAFEAGAIDYLLKPFDNERLSEALQRARLILARRRMPQMPDQKSVADPPDGRHQPKPLVRVAVRSGDRIALVETAGIDWIRGAANYAELHVGPKVHFLRQTLSVLEDQLPPDRFVRISRSLFVNLDRVVEVRSKSHGDWLVVLRDGTRLSVSRSYRSRLRAILSNGH